MLNHVQLIGHLGRDPDIKQTNSGERVASFSIATTERWKDKATGEKREATEWHRVVVFGKLAEIVEDWATKGTLVYVSGKLVTRKYQAKDGTEKQSTEIHASGFKLLTGSSGVLNKQDEKPANSNPALSKSSQFNDLDDDIPF